MTVSVVCYTSLKLVTVELVKLNMIIVDNFFSHKLINV